MKLSQAKAGRNYTITGRHTVGPAAARLDSLGLVEGETVYVHVANFAGILVEIKGSRLALCAQVAEEVDVA